jgi:hypothetical protein
VQASTHAHRREHRGDPAADVPRQHVATASDLASRPPGSTPARATRCGRSCARSSGRARPSCSAHVPGGGRPARRRHRRHRPGAGDRRGHPGAAQGLGRHRCPSRACAGPGAAGRRRGAARPGGRHRVPGRVAQHLPHQGRGRPLPLPAHLAAGTRCWGRCSATPSATSSRARSSSCWASRWASARTAGRSARWARRGTGRDGHRHLAAGRRRPALVVLPLTTRRYRSR